jgi:hypothetical protein
MSEPDGLRSAREVDVDAERFVDDEPVEEEMPAAVDLPPEGSIPDIIDQRIDVPTDDEA